MSSSLCVEVPPHVPAHLVVDFDYHREAGLTEDPHATRSSFPAHPHRFPWQAPSRSGCYRWKRTRQNIVAIGNPLTHP